MSFYPKFPQPGPQEGSARPTNAPNNGSMGGRPPTSTGVTSASPIERLLTELVPGAPVSFPPASAGGEMWPNAQGGGGGNAGGEMWPDAQGAPSPTAPTQPASPTAPGAPTAPSAPTAPITINVGTGGGAAAPDAGAPPGAPVSAPPATAASPVQPTPGLPSAAPTPPPAPPPVRFERTPREDELALVPEGSEVITPYGTGVKKGGRVERYNLTPAGQEAYKRAIVAARERYGPTPFDGDLDAPFQPPIVLDGWNYNPWAPPGREWSRG